MSFEVFPPKSSSGFESVSLAVREIAALSPSFVSVTYGAGGGTGKYTLEIAREVKDKWRVPTLAHLTCVCSSKDSVREKIEQFKAAQIQNVMALRGDIPRDMQDCDRTGWEYSHATELISELKVLGGFCIGGACYPEVHPESKSREFDRFMLREKVQAGCSFLTTQMFFDNSVFKGFLDELGAIGVNVPVIPGIMPITSHKQIAQILNLSQAYIPRELMQTVERYSDDAVSMRQAGIEYAIKQARDLYSLGVKNVHIYTMNKPDVAAEIMKGVSELLGE